MAFLGRYRLIAGRHVGIQLQTKFADGAKKAGGRPGAGRAHAHQTTVP
jgi:hypothetical protein